MYFAEIFNSIGLFQNLGGWIGTLDGTGTKARTHIVLQRAYQVLFHLEQCDHLERLAREQFDPYARSIADLPDCIHAWSPLVANLMIELSAALGALRILQNEVWMLAASASGVKDAPASMRKAYKAISQKNSRGSTGQRLSTDIPDDVRNAIAKYWTNSGETMAAYRDIDQHHDVLARGCFLLTAGNAVQRVSVRLPDNPELKSPARFTYDKNMDGLDLAHTGFSALHELVEEMAKLVNAPRAPLQQTIEFAPAIEHKAGVARTTGLMIFNLDGRTALVMGQDEELHVTLKPVTI
jgi:hypothetical protein